MKSVATKAYLRICSCLLISKKLSKLTLESVAVSISVRSCQSLPYNLLPSKLTLESVAIKAYLRICSCLHISKKLSEALINHRVKECQIVELDSSTKQMLKYKKCRFKINIPQWCTVYNTVFNTIFLIEILY